MKINKFVAVISLSFLTFLVLPTKEILAYSYGSSYSSPSYGSQSSIYGSNYSNQGYYLRYHNNFPGMYFTGYGFSNDPSYGYGGSHWNKYNDVSCLHHYCSPEIKGPSSFSNNSNDRIYLEKYLKGKIETFCKSKVPGDEKKCVKYCKREGNKNSLCVKK